MARLHNAPNPYADGDFGTSKLRNRVGDFQVSRRCHQPRGQRCDVVNDGISKTDRQRAGHMNVESVVEDAIDENANTAALLVTKSLASVPEPCQSTDLGRRLRISAA